MDHKFEQLDGAQMSEVFLQKGSVSILINKTSKELTTHTGWNKCYVFVEEGGLLVK